jgi:hypothetical protein
VTDTRSAEKILVMNSLGNCPFGRPRRWEDNIKVHYDKQDGGSQGTDYRCQGYK